MKKIKHLHILCFWAIALSGCKIQSIHFDDYHYAHTPIRVETASIQKDKYTLLLQLQQVEKVWEQYYYFKKPALTVPKVKKGDTRLFNFLEIAAKGYTQGDSTYITMALIIPPHLRNTTNYVSLERKKARYYTHDKPIAAIPELGAYRQGKWLYFSDTLFIDFARAGQKVNVGSEHIFIHIDTAYFRKEVQRDTFSFTKDGKYRSALFRASIKNIGFYANVSVEIDKINMKLSGIDDDRSKALLFRPTCKGTQIVFKDSTLKPIPLVCYCIGANTDYPSKYLSYNPDRMKDEEEPTEKKKFIRQIERWNNWGTIFGIKLY